MGGKELWGREAGEPQRLGFGPWGSAHQSPFLWEGSLDHSWLSALRKREGPGVDRAGDPSLPDNGSLKQLSQLFDRLFLGQKTLNSFWTPRESCFAV